MSRITIDLDDTQDTRIVRAFALAQHYRAQLSDGSDNPETKKQFMVRRLKEFIRQSVIEAEAMEAAENARQTAQTKAETEILIP